MIYWNTGDRVVDCILQKMEGLSTWREDSSPEQIHDLLGALINIEKMLPKSVAQHFKLPYLYVGNSHFELGDDYRKRLINEITTALKTGLDNAINDPQLKKNGGADFSDRPISKGEKILEAVDEFENEQTQSTLDHLKSAVYSTNLNYRVQTIEKLLGRTRSYQNQSPAVAMHGEIYRLRNEAEIYYSMKAH